MAGRVRRSRYEHAEGLSLQQAQRDLRDLVTAQILEPVGRTRARLVRVLEQPPPQIRRWVEEVGDDDAHRFLASVAPLARPRY